MDRRTDKRLITIRCKENKTEVMLATTISHMHESIWVSIVDTDCVALHCA